MVWFGLGWILLGWHGLLNFELRFLTKKINNQPLVLMLQLWLTWPAQFWVSFSNQKDKWSAFCIDVNITSFPHPPTLLSDYVYSMHKFPTEKKFWNTVSYFYLFMHLAQFGNHLHLHLHTLPKSHLLVKCCAIFCHVIRVVRINC